MSLEQLLQITVREKASDLHLCVGIPPAIRVNGELKFIKDLNLTTYDTENYAKEILKDNYEKYLKEGEMDVSYSISGIGRFRVSVYKQRGSTSIAFRMVSLKVPNLTELKLPDVVKKFSNLKRGLVLITGPTGSGKSSTLAAIINEINSNRSEHIITLEDPIEFLHKHKKSIVNQREVGTDTKSYELGLKSILREDPNVILIGELRDLDTISTALTAAETGHLVLSTLHTMGASKTIDRIINVFPPHQQQQIKMQLASVLQAIVFQQLVPTINKETRLVSTEIMVCTDAIKNMIREGKTYQIESSIQTGRKYGMQTMDMCLADLYKNKHISYETALNFSMNKDLLSKLMKL